MRNHLSGSLKWAVLACASALVSTPVLASTSVSALNGLMSASVAQSGVKKEGDEMKKVLRERMRTAKKQFNTTQQSATNDEVPVAAPQQQAPELLAQNDGQANPAAPNAPAGAAAVGAAVLAADQAAPAPAPAAPAQAPGAVPAVPTPLVNQTFAPGQEPVLTFLKASHDFGEQLDGVPLVVKFPFKNTGKSKLVINAINTGCGCTAAKLAKQEFEPGEGDEIEITYNPKTSGKQQRAIAINSNDPNSPATQLMISANVIPFLEARPNAVQFGQISIGEPREIQLVVVSRDPNMKVTGVSSNGPEVVAEVVPGGKPNVMVEQDLPGVAVINVKLLDSAPVGRLTRQLSIKVLATKVPGEEPKEEELKVFAFGQIQGELTLNPQQIRVPPVAPGTPFEREVIVTRRGNKEFKILSAEVVNSTLPGVQVTTEAYQQGEVIGHKIKLSGTTGPAAGNYRGSLMVTTDVAREEKTEIQFSGIIRAVTPAAAPGGMQPAPAPAAAPAAAPAPAPVPAPAQPK